MMFILAPFIQHTKVFEELIYYLFSYVDSVDQKEQKELETVLGTSSQEILEQLIYQSQIFKFDRDWKAGWYRDETIE